MSFRSKTLILALAALLSLGMAGDAFARAGGGFSMGSRGYRTYSVAADHLDIALERRAHPALDDALWQLRAGLWLRFWIQPAGLLRRRVRPGPHRRILGRRPLRPALRAWILRRPWRRHVVPRPAAAAWPHLSSDPLRDEFFPRRPAGLFRRPFWCRLCRRRSAARQLWRLRLGAAAHFGA